MAGRMPSTPGGPPGGSDAVPRDSDPGPDPAPN